MVDEEKTANGKTEDKTVRFISVMWKQWRRRRRNVPMNGELDESVECRLVSVRRGLLKGGKVSGEKEKNEQVFERRDVAGRAESAFQNTRITPRSRSHCATLTDRAPLSSNPAFLFYITVSGNPTPCISRLPHHRCVRGSYITPFISATCSLSPPSSYPYHSPANRAHT